MNDTTPDGPYVPDERPGDFLGKKLAPDGQLLTVMPLLFGAAQITRGQNGAGSFDEHWDYASVEQALFQFLVWDGAAGTEPEGWTRASKRGEPDYRRRPGGNPALEYRAP